MFYLGLFLMSHLIAGLIGMLIDYLFYREEIPEVIEEASEEFSGNIKLTRSMYSIVSVLFGWYTFFMSLYAIYDYYFIHDEDDDEE